MRIFHQLLLTALLICFTFFLHAQPVRILFPQKHSSVLNEVKSILLKNNLQLITYGDETPLVWDIRSKALVKRLTGHEGGVTKIITNDHGILTVSSDRAIFWNYDFENLGEFYSERSGISDIDFSYPYLATTGWLQAHIWNVVTGKLVRTITLGSSSWGLKIRLRPSSHHVFTLGTNYFGSSIIADAEDWERHSADTVIRIWDFMTGDEISQVSPHAYPIFQMEMDSSRNVLFVRTEIGNLSRYTITDGYHPLEEKGPALAYLLENARESFDPADPVYKAMDMDSFYLDPSTNYLLATGLSSNFVYDISHDKIIDTSAIKTDESGGLAFKPRNPFFYGGMIYSGQWDGYKRYNTKTKALSSFTFQEVEDVTDRYVIANHESGDAGGVTAVYSPDGTLIKDIYKHVDNILNCYPDGKGNIVLVCSNGISILDLNRATVERLAGRIKNYGKEYISNRTRFLYNPGTVSVLKSDLHGGDFKKIDLGDHSVKDVPLAFTGNTQVAGFTKSGAQLFGLANDTVRIIDYNSMAITRQFVQPLRLNHFAKKWMSRMEDPQTSLERPVLPLAGSLNGKLFAVSINDSLLHIKDAVTGMLVAATKFPSNFKKQRPEFSFMKFIQHDKKLFYIDSHSNARIIDTKTGRVETAFEIPNNWEDIVDVFEIDNRYLLWITDIGYWEKYDCITHKIVASFDLKPTSSLGFNYQPAEKKMLTWTNADTVKIWDIHTGRQVASLRTGLDQIKKAMYDAYAKRIVVVNKNFQVKVFDAASYRALYTVTMMGEDYVFWLDDGYYMSTKEAATSIQFQVGEKAIYSFDQFDTKMNRPDKVLMAMGNSDTSLISSYRRAYWKRMTRLGLDTTSTGRNFNVPQLSVIGEKQVVYDQLEERLSLHVVATDSLFTLDRFNIWVNECPLYGQRGIPLRTRDRSRLDTVVVIPLSTGENRIEVSVYNSNGTESYRSPITVNYSPARQTPEKTWFIGIGIDRFSNSTYNLRYSTKDIRDLSTKLKAKYGEQIIIDTLFNEQVTLAAVKKLKEKLRTAGVNDRVIISYSGHGLLSKEFDYYLSTYDIDFDNPAQGGLPYEELENLVDNIQPRKKLVLIDACHSGELDKQDLIKLDHTPDSLIKGLKPVGYKEGGVGLKSSFELMQSLFVNVGKNTGATVISAAAGTQFALERNDLANGVFTYAILEAMQQYPSMKVSALKKIVGSRVSQLTNGLQQPTSRNETIISDWNVW